jgi:hypothetical protein
MPFIVSENTAVSTGRCNTGLQFTRWRLKAQGLSRALIETHRDLIEMSLRVDGQVGPLGEVLSQQAVCIFIAAALPGTLRITEVDLHLRVYREALVFGHLQPPVPSQRAPQSRREFSHVLAQFGDDRLCIFTGHFDEHDETRVSFHQSGDMSVFTACEQIALPVTGNSAVFNLGRPFPNRDGIDDLTVGLSASPCVPRTANRPLGPQVLNQLFFSTPRAWMNKLR